MLKKASKSCGLVLVCNNAKKHLPFFKKLGFLYLFEFVFEIKSTKKKKEENEGPTENGVSNPRLRIGIDQGYW